jgi:hypothetical protein
VALVTCARAASLVDTGVGIVSRVSTGGFLSTSDARRTLEPPPEVDVMRRPGHSLESMVAAHFERVDRASVVALAPADVQPLILELQAASLAHNIRRRLYVPADQAHK